MNSEFPPELWTAIARFLPKDIVKGFYSISKAFFDIAMDEMYGEVTIDLEQVDRDYRKTMFLMRLDSEDLLPPHVRELTINLVDLPKKKSTVSGTMFRFLGYLVGLLDGGKEVLFAGLVTGDQLDAALCRIIPRLENLERVKLSTARLTAIPPVLKCLDPLWRLCSESVTHLHIHFSISQFPVIFNDSYRSLLQDNRIQALILQEAPLCPYSEADSIAGQLAVMDLVECCQPSLRKLSIVGPNSEIDRLPLLSHLEGLDFPQLSDLSLEKFASTFPADRLSRISLIQRHARSLESLSLLARDKDDASFDFDTLDDLDLQALEISAVYIFQSPKGALSFLLSQPNLKRLSIAGIIPVPHFLATLKLLKSWQDHNPSRTLQELKLNLGVDFTFRILAELASRIKVNKLTVKFMYHKLAVNQGNGGMLCKPSCGFPYVENLGVMPELSASFFDQLASFDEPLRNWNLRQLVLQSDVCCGTRTLWGIMFACSQRIPSLGQVLQTDTTGKPLLPANDFVQCSKECLLKKDQSLVGFQIRIDPTVTF